MSKKCTVTTRLKTDINSDSEDIFYIEDYVCFGNIKKARELTDEIFINNKEFIEKYDYNGYKITWAWYDKVYQFCLKYTEIEKLLYEIKEMKYSTINLVGINKVYNVVFEKFFFNCNVVYYKKVNFTGKIKEFITNLVLLIFSLFSFIYFWLKNKDYVGIWIGDFVYKNTKSDFRTNKLYDKMHVNQIHYIEFIRTRTLKDFLINTYKRRRFSIYYFSIIYFVGLFLRKRNYEVSNFYHSVLCEYERDNLIMIKVVKILEFVLHKLKIRSIISFSFMSRNAHLHLAAKSLGIKTIGIMHGLSRKDYLVNEFIESYFCKKFIGPDVFGVWSRHLVDYYKKYCKIIPENKIFYSGLLRPLDNFNTYKNEKFVRLSDNKIKVLIISEPLVNPIEILPYIKAIHNNDLFELAIKTRPMIRDSYYEKLIEIFPEIKEVPVFNGKIEEDGMKFDVFLGSHSTALLEASLINKISVFVATEKWEDYFDVSTICSDNNMLVTSVSDICSHIVYRCNTENIYNTIEKIRSYFFGDNKDGPEWILNEIRRVL